MSKLLLTRIIIVVGGVTGFGLFVADIPHHVAQGAVVMALTTLAVFIVNYSELKG